MNQTEKIWHGNISSKIRNVDGSIFVHEYDIYKMVCLFLGLDVDSFDLLDYEMKDQELHVTMKKNNFVSTHIFGRKSSSSPSFEEAIKPD